MFGWQIIVLAKHYLDVDEILYWAGAMLTIIAVASAIIIPLYRMLKKYGEALKHTQETLEEQSGINAQYQQLIDESKEDRAKLNSDIAIIKRATLTQIKLEINKIADKAIEREWILNEECERIEMLWENYQPLGGNGITTRKMTDVRTLPIRYRASSKGGTKQRTTYEGEK